MTKKLGRLPRAFNHKIPHMSAMLMGATSLAVLPPSVNYAPASISNFGAMLNDQLGDCTCAAVYHAVQIWSLTAQKNEITESDDTVLSLYEKACGYDPTDPSTDQGGVEQNVLTYLLNNGIPMDSGTPQKILAFYEVDSRNIQDVKQAIYECGVAYIGIDVPASLMAGAPPAVWGMTDDENIVGGHAIILTGYDETGFDLISWGQKFRMTYGFFSTYTEEVYAIVDPLWVSSTGKTPCGMTVAALEQMMKSMA